MLLRSWLREVIERTRSRAGTGISRTRNRRSSFHHSSQSVTELLETRTLLTAINSFSPDTGVPGDGITNDNTPTLFGSGALPHTTVYIYDGAGEQIGYTNANGAGLWTWTSSVNPPLGDGLHTFTAQQEGQPASAPFEVTIDTQVSLGSLAFDDASITEADDGNTVTLTLTFGEDMNQTIHPAITTNAATTLTNPTNGQWTSATTYTLDYTVADANVELADVTVSVTDAVDLHGNEVAVTAAASGTAVDTIAPSVTITDDAPGIANIATGDVTFTFTFNEAVTGFDADDVTVAGGTKGAFTAVSDSVYTLVVTPNAGSNADITVDVAAAVATDAAANSSTAATQAVQTVDTTAPTVVITDDEAGVANIANGNVIFTFTFSEDVTGFDTTDVTLTGGTRGTFTAVSGSVYTLVVTPNANSTTDITVDVAASLVTDAGGNTNPAATQAVQLVDTVAPTVTITDDEAGVAGVSGGDVVFTFTFSEAVTGFDASDVVVTGGTKGTFTAVSGTEYTLAVTPTPNSTDDITVNVAAGVAVDAASNPNTAATQAVQTVDTTVPTIAITDDEDGVANIAGGDVTFTFTFSKAVTGFDASDITVAGGTKGTFTAVSGTVYTLVVTPDADSVADITVDVAASVATDASGNGNTAATQATQAVDTTAPSVAITDDEGGVANIAGGDVVFTFTFSEAVTGFDADDITVAGGTKSTFTAVSGTEYTLAVTPAASSTTAITVDVAASVATDANGNGNTAATQATQTVDTTAPTVTITDDEAATANIAGGDVIFTFTFSEAVTGFDAGDVTVAGGTKGTFTAVSGTEYTLAVTPDTSSTTDITVDVAASVATDANGNNNTAATQATQAVDTVAPSVAITDDEVGIATISGGDVLFTFTFSEAVTGFDADDVTVTGGTMARPIKNVPDACWQSLQGP
jgi:large repetitive protein